MRDQKSLTAGLADLGLGKYEADAYVALLSRGEMSASELAYHAKISRTKVYPVLVRLEKKHLATLTRGRQVMCAAVDPRESFEDLIEEQVGRARETGALVAKLQAVGERAKGRRGIGERRYVHAAGPAALERIREAIRSAGSSIHAISDASGAGLLAECGAALSDASKKGVRIMAAVSPEAVGSPELRDVAHSARVRITELVQNVMVVDGAHVIVVDGGTGNAAIFSSSEVLAGQQERMFASVWKGAMPADALAALPASDAREVYRTIRIVGGMDLGRTPADAKPSEYDGMIGLLEGGGVRLRGRRIERIVALADAAVGAACSGSVVHDAGAGTILVESGLNGGHSLPWARMLEECLQAGGAKTRTAYQKRARAGERVRITIC